MMHPNYFVKSLTYILILSQMRLKKNLKLDG